MKPPIRQTAVTWDRLAHQLTLLADWHVQTLDDQTCAAASALGVRDRDFDALIEAADHLDDLNEGRYEHGPFEDPDRTELLARETHDYALTTCVHAAAQALIRVKEAA